MVKWRVILETILLLSTVSVAYGSKYEIISKIVSLHFTHIITISLFTIDIKETTHGKMIKSYHKLYTYVNLTLDCCALAFTIGRWFIMDGIKVDQFVGGKQDLPLIISWAFMFLYVLHVIMFIIFDIIVMIPRSARVASVASEVSEVSEVQSSGGSRGSVASAAVSSFFKPVTSQRRVKSKGLHVTIPAMKFRFGPSNRYSNV